MKERKLFFKITLVLSFIAGFALMLYDAGERYTIFRDSLAREIVIKKTNNDFADNAGYIDAAASGKNSATEVLHELLNKEKQAIGFMDVIKNTRFGIFMGTFFLLGFAQLWMLYFLIMLGLTSKKKR